MTERVTVLHAGAATDLVSRGLGPALLEGQGIEVIGVPGHSMALALRLLDGSIEGDVYLTADAKLNSLLIGDAGHDLVSWFLVFARNEIVLAYSASGPLASSFERVKRGEVPWFEVVAQPGIRLGSNDPNQDPLGYFTLLVCALAEQHYGQPDLKSRVLGDDVNQDQVGRASLTGLAECSLDAMFLYRSAAIGKPFGFIDLPGEINLGDTALAETYSSAHFRTSAGHDLRGTPISFSAAVVASAHNRVAAVRFVDFLLSPAGQEIVQAFHFIPGPILLGGSLDMLPRELAGRVQGAFVSLAL